MRFNSIIEALAYWAEADPDKICFVDAETDKVCTYRQMWDWSYMFARHLETYGFEKGFRLVARVSGVIDTNVAMFGTFLAGGVYCSTEQNMKELKLRELLTEYGAVVLASSEPFDWGGVSIDIKELSRAPVTETDFNWQTPNPDDLAIVVFTTGTTGKAKGVMHSYHTHLVPMYGWVNEMGIAREDVFLSVQPLERAGGIFHYYSAIIAGGTVVHHGGVVFAARLFNAIRKYGINTTYIQAPALQILMDTDMESFVEAGKQIRILATGGAAVSESLKEKLVQAMPKTKLYVIYAATECIWIGYYQFNDKIGKANCIGKAAPGNDIKIVMQDSQLSYEGKNAGVVAIKSDCRFIGYYNDEELYQKTVVDDYLHMTDIGFLDDDGYLYLLGRRDDIIETGGYKVAPYEVEEVAMQMDGILECACIGIPNKVMGHIPKLFVRMETGKDFSARDIAKFMEQRLETYKMPRIITEVEDFPRVGGTTKIDKKELLKNV